MTSSPGPGHRFPVRVYYEDTDAAGIVYHATYLRFAERARTEFMRDHGLEHTALAAAEGLVFAVHRAEIDFVRPARLDDLLLVETTPESRKGASLTLLQAIRRGDEPIARLRIRLVLLDRRGRPARLPEALVGALAGH